MSDGVTTMQLPGEVDALARAQAQVAALEQLLEVYERTSIEQTTRLDRARAEEQEGRERLFGLFMQAPAAITVLEGPEHVFTVVNPLYRELIGGRDVRGLPVRAALPELEGQGFFELLDRVYESGEPFEAREALVQLDRDRNGVLEELYLDFVYQPLRDPAGGVYAIMAHAVDVSAQVRARREVERNAAELLRLSQELERSNRDLDQFAYVASHDLKAPLRGIANLTEWIAEDLSDRLTEESAGHMALLKGRVHRMEALIDGILTYSRAGRERQPAVDVDVRALVLETIELVAPPAGAIIAVDGALPVIRTERVPLQQVLLNLIANAFKYNASAAPRLEVSGSVDEPGWLHVAVRDDGPGIAPEYHARVWQIFQTLAARDKVEGTGIGLSVVRKLVDHRGGRAWLDSAPGHGSTFHFTWPMTPRTP